MEKIIEELRELNESVPIPLCLPTPQEISDIEAELEISFHPDYVQYLLRASDVVYGALEPATITDPASHTHLPEIAKTAWQVMGVPKELRKI